MFTLASDGKMQNFENSTGQRKNLRMMARNIRQSNRKWGEKKSSRQVLADFKNWTTFSFVGNAGIAPFSITVRAPQPFAKTRASLNLFSSLYKEEFEAKLFSNPATNASPAPCCVYCINFLTTNPTLKFLGVVSAAL